MSARRGSAVVVACVVLSLLAGCNADPNIAEPESGGTFRIALSSVDSLDPASADTLEEQLIAEQLFESLTRWNPVSLEAESAIASSWTVSADQRVFDFSLRTDLTFANGRTITADDVKYSIERVSRKDSISPLSEILAPVTGFVAWHVDAVAGGMTGIVATSPTTLRISLDQPWSVLPSVLANPGFGVVPREAVEAVAPAELFVDRPVASGAFQFDRRDADGSIMLTRRASGVIKSPYVDAVQIRFYGSQAETYAALKDDQVDWARVPTSDAAEAVDLFGEDGIRSYFAVLYYGLNANRPELADRRFREAIVRSVDRPTINRDDFAGTTIEIDGVVPRGVPGSQDDPCQGKCTFDRSVSTQLIKDSYSLVAPPAVFIDFDDDPLQTTVATRIKDGLGAVGVPSTLRPHAAADYPAFVRSGEASLFRLGWVATYPHADAFLTPLFATAAPGNLLKYSNPAVDISLALARSNADLVARNDAYRAAERAVIQDYAVIPIAQYRVFSAAQPDARGIALNGMGLYDASSVWMR
jgi:ABC-type transport system substrate-binding protein